MFRGTRCSMPNWCAHCGSTSTPAWRKGWLVGETGGSTGNNDDGDNGGGDGGGAKAGNGDGGEEGPEAAPPQYVNLCNGCGLRYTKGYSKPEFERSKARLAGRAPPPDAEVSLRVHAAHWWRGYWVRGWRCMRCRPILS